MWSSSLTHTRTGSRHEPYDKIPLIITVSFSGAFEKFIIRITDYIFQEILLLYLDELYLKFPLVS